MLTSAKQLLNWNADWFFVLCKRKQILTYSAFYLQIKPRLSSIAQREKFDCFLRSNNSSILLECWTKLFHNVYLLTSLFANKFWNYNYDWCSAKLADTFFNLTLFCLRLNALKPLQIWHILSWTICSFNEVTVRSSTFISNWF